MAEYFFDLGEQDRREALEYGRAETDRPVHLLEKDVWVVWVLRALFESSLAADLTFKGGTSLSKVYKVIDRFSEDIDLTYDIRKLIPDLIGEGGDLPASRSQASKWTQTVRHRLPDWITQNVQPVLQAALTHEHLDARLELGGQENDKLFLHYPALIQGTGYVAPAVALEFGARATGEPHQVFQVTCDIAAHVFCAQGRIRSERYARHWHDLAAIARSPHFTAVIADRAVATAVARHKSCFFIEKNAEGQVIDYMPATTGHLKIVPEGQARTALAEDYAAMLADEVMVGNAISFDELLEACADLEAKVNSAVAN